MSSFLIGKFFPPPPFCFISSHLIFDPYRWTCNGIQCTGYTLRLYLVWGRVVMTHKQKRYRERMWSTKLLMTPRKITTFCWFLFLHSRFICRVLFQSAHFEIEILKWQMNLELRQICWCTQTLYASLSGLCLCAFWILSQTKYIFVIQAIFISNSI